jgi:chromosome segregation ATPase
MAEEAISCIQDARAETKSQANEISSVLSNVSAELSSSVESLEPILSVIQQMNSCSNALKEELSRLDSGNKLSNALEELQDVISQTKIVLVDSIKPRRVVLVEEVVE